MYSKFNLASILIFIASTVPSMAIAQPSSTSPSSYETTADVIERAFFKNNGTAFREQSIAEQFNAAFGVGTIIKNSYPENQVRRDSELADTIYRDALRQQSGGKIMRTRDLPSPYNSSVLLQSTTSSDR